MTPPLPSWTAEPDAPEVLESNWLFELRRERFRSRLSDAVRDFYVVHLADAVNVVAVTPERKVIFVRQFRAGSRRDSLEPPGGLLNPGEDPIEAGIRELREETGYEGDTPWVLGTIWANPSILSARITTLVILNARPTARPHPDEGEELEIVEVPDRAVPALIRDGKINHALAVSGLLWWMAAELPSSPMELLPPTTPRRYQFRIRSLVFLVIASGVIFGVMANLGMNRSVWLFIILAIPATQTLSLHFFAIEPGSVLQPAAPSSHQAILRLFAMLGIFGVVLGIMLLLCRLTGLF